MFTIRFIWEFLILFIAAIAAAFLYFSPQIDVRWGKGARAAMYLLVAAFVVSEFFLKGLTGEGYEDRIARFAGDTFCAVSSASSLCLQRRKPTQPPIASAGAESVTLLSCKFNGRNIPAMVLLKDLKKLRIWFGDRGGQEWTNVDFSRDPIMTSVNDDGRSIVLSNDYKFAIFNEGEEHLFGDCHPDSLTGKPLWWFAPELIQEWQFGPKG